MTKLELLAPARDAEIGRQAILHGADAVYIGGPTHGARASASNSIEDIARLADFAHQYGAKVYATVNTIVYEQELLAVEKTIRQLHHAGVDALIVQDLGILRLDIPPIALHASTQCDIRTVEKAQFLAACGFSQLVLPRELTEHEIRLMRNSVPGNVALEAFVHGALCVSYSGDCQASFLANGRSANRGECAQMCRMAYDLVDVEGNIILKDKHLLSLRDLNRFAEIPAMIQAGITSFKIEGRLKDIVYVKNVVGVYRKVIDKFIDASPQHFCRSSWGESRLSFDPDLNKAFNRGFTPYFFHKQTEKQFNNSMASLDTPKWVGEKVGTVTKNLGKSLIVDISTPLNNGDGLAFLDENKRFTGFRLNKIDKNRLYPATPTSVKPGTQLFRNSDNKREQMLLGPTAQRIISLDMTLRMASSGILALDIADEYGHRCTSTICVAKENARSTQNEIRLKTLSKLGGTIFVLRNLDDLLDPLTFVPISTLTQLRRDGIELFKNAIKCTYEYEYRLKEDATAIVPNPKLTYHDNVANSKAIDFYKSHGADTIEYAIEVNKPPKGPVNVMTTRYCLRRELGACLKTQEGKKLPTPIFIQNKAARYLLDFDCKNCVMHVQTTKPNSTLKY